MSSSKSKTLTRVDRAEKDAKRKPIEIVQTIKKAQMAIAHTHPLSETTTSDGKDAFALRFQTSFDQVHFLTKKFSRREVIVKCPIIKEDFSFEELCFIPQVFESRK